MHKPMTLKDNDHLGGGFLEHIFTKRVKLTRFTRRIADGDGIHVKI